MTHNNFDFLRLFAASMVVFGHSFYLLKLHEPYPVILDGQMYYGIVGVWIFFSISGYLITQSLLYSKSYAQYLVKRSLRIFPALILNILIVVFVLGALVTNLTLKDYFSSSETYRYLLNIFLYRLVYFLPGVFTNNPDQAVNGSLWTLSYEFTFYLGIVLLHFFYILRNKYVYTGLYILSVALWIIITETKYFDAMIPVLNLQFKYFFGLATYFGAGALFFLWRDKIPLKFTVSLILLVIWIIACCFHLGLVFGYLCLPYIVFWFAFESKIKINASKYGDFSYGMYIYGFPAQQTIIYLMGGISPWLLFIISFPTTFLLAAFSWFTVEKRALALKRRIFKK